MSTVIKIENLWKEYRLGVIGHGTLTHDLQSWWANIRGKEDPNAKITPALGAQEKQIEGDCFWALRGVNLEVKQGEILGIIGKNGAGKSTLLKILSRVTAPTRGSIKVKGRIASLLEVGTGFHPELTGRENIFMNGAILGMSKPEIKSKLDEIIDFSGVEDFIETPVKRYSSGMYVRLAFAVAAHLDPEILIVDEVLSVGDAEFQTKCLGKMRDVGKEGRTVLFVSHNLSAVEQLCTKGVLLAAGTVYDQSNVHNIINSYLDKFVIKSLQNGIVFFGTIPESSIEIISLKINKEIAGQNLLKILPSEEILFKINLTLNMEFKDIIFSLFIMSNSERIFTINYPSSGATIEILKNSLIEVTFKIPKYLLRPSTYVVGFGANTPDKSEWFCTNELTAFSVLERWDNHNREDNIGIFNICAN